MSNLSNQDFHDPRKSKIRSEQSNSKYAGSAPRAATLHRPHIHRMLPRVMALERSLPSSRRKKDSMTQVALRALAPSDLLSVQPPRCLPRRSGSRELSQNGRSALKVGSTRSASVPPVLKPQLAAGPSGTAGRPSLRTLSFLPQPRVLNPGPWLGPLPLSSPFTHADAGRSRVSAPLSHFPSPGAESRTQQKSAAAAEPASATQDSRAMHTLHRHFREGLARGGADDVRGGAGPVAERGLRDESRD